MGVKVGISVDVKADLVGFNSAVDSQEYIVYGNTALNDSLPRFYYYSAASSATPDGEAVLAATGMGGTGRYLKITQLQATPKRQEKYSGTTNASGDYTVTFLTAFPVAPNIQANIVGGTALQRSVITSITTTGFTINVVSQNTNTLLGIISLVSSTTPVNGASVDVLISEK